MNFFPNKLSKPDCSGVSNTEVKVAPNRHCWIKWNRAYATLFSQLIHLPAIIASLLATVKVAVVLLLNQVFLHPISSLFIDLGFRQYASFSNRKNLIEPVGLISSSHLSEVPSVVFSAWGIDKCTPAPVCSQDRFNELVSHGVHQAPLAKDNASGVSSHDPIVSVARNQLDQRLTACPVDPNLHFGIVGMSVDDLLRNIIQHPFPIISHSVPDNPLSLSKSWQEVIICPGFQIGSLDHVIPHRRIFPPTAMYDPTSVFPPIIQII